MSSATNHTASRATLATVGAIAGLALWALFDVVPDLIDNERLVMFLISGGVGFFGALLALLGPVRLVPASVSAALLSIPAALLLLWASFRFADLDAFFDTPHAVAAFSYLVTVSIPFCAAAIGRTNGWRRYEDLFDLAWTIAVRYAAASLFVSVVWGVVLLSDALLGLVGIDAIEQLLDMDPVPYVLSGLALGLGLAIVYELRDYVSPFLLIQLLRVLLPVLLVVLVVFILALPFRGLSDLFGTFSAAATLASVAFAGITLITTSLHRDDTLSVEGPIMLMATQTLSLIVPVPAFLAVFAIWLRVDQYGLTPDRVAAMATAVLIFLYATSYAISVLMRRNWRNKIRQSNTLLALTTLLIAVLWMTPVLNAERLSANSQLLRAQSGVDLDDLALWELSHEWGYAGVQALNTLRENSGRDDHVELVALIERAESETSRYAFEREKNVTLIASLEGIVPLRPLGAELPLGALESLPDHERRMIHEACARLLSDGQPGCVIVMADFHPLVEAQQAIGLFLTEEDTVRSMGLWLRGSELYRTGRVDNIGSGVSRINADTISDVLTGEFQISPVPRNVLDVGGLKLIPDN